MTASGLSPLDFEFTSSQISFVQGTQFSGDGVSEALTFTDMSNNTFLQVDANADGTADMQVHSEGPFRGYLRRRAWCRGRRRGEMLVGPCAASAPSLADLCHNISSRNRFNFNQWRWIAATMAAFFRPAPFTKFR